MTSCQPIGPLLNSDISGIGVRISFYLQALFLGFLSARSGSLDEIAGALYTLMATNAAMAVTGLILGLKTLPEISFQDALVMIYLLSMSWVVVFASMASCNRLSDDTKVLQLASVIQSYLILAFAFTVLAKAHDFGKTPGCNQDAVVVIFRPFSALKSGHILGYIVVGLAFASYSLMTVRDYTAQVLKKIQEIKERRRRAEANERPPTATTPSYQSAFKSKDEMAKNLKAPQRQGTSYGQPILNVDGQLLFMLGFILLFWTFFVLNTELLIRWNQSAQDSAGVSWQFGQVLPLFLVVLPLVNMISVFNKFGIRHTKLKKQSVEVMIIDDSGGWVGGVC